MENTKWMNLSQKEIDALRLSALDKFMKECGDAFQYTATVSKYFTIPELFAIKNFMYTHDVRRLLQWAHQRFEETNLPQWSHSEKWKKYCKVCQAREEISHECSIEQ